MTQKDVIIILGHSVSPDGSLPDIPKLRVQKGVELFKEGLAEYIIVSGGHPFAIKDVPSRSESAAMKEYAVAQGIPTDKVLEEKESKDTLGNIYFCKISFLDPNNWKNIIVVTSDYHIPRTRYIFEKVLGKEYTVDYIPAESNLTEEQLKNRITKEAGKIESLKKWYESIEPGDIKAIKELMYTVHPAYKNSD